MSNLEKLLARGAELVAGDLILRGMSMGLLRNGDLQITPEGLNELEVQDVQAKPAPAPAKPPKSAPAKAPKPAKAAPEINTTPKEAAPAAENLEIDLGDLLGN